MYDIVKDIRLANGGRVVVGVDKHEIIFRVIRPDELDTIYKGIIPKDITNKNFTPLDHVRDKTNRTSYNSATINITKAERWANKTGNRIVAIDLNKLLDDQIIVDLTTDELRRIRLLDNKKAIMYAEQSSEVLIKGNINHKAVQILDEEDIIRLKNSQKQQATIKRECKRGRSHK